MKEHYFNGDIAFVIYTPQDFYYKTEIEAGINGWSYDEMKVYRLQQAIVNSPQWKNLDGNECCLYVLLNVVYDGKEESDSRLKKVKRCEIADSFIHTLTEEDFCKQIQNNMFFRNYGNVVYHGQYLLFDKYSVSWLMAERILRVVGRDVIADHIIQDAVMYHGYTQSTHSENESLVVEKQNNHSEEIPEYKLPFDWKYNRYISSNKHFLHDRLICGCCGEFMTRRTLRGYNRPGEETIRYKAWECSGHHRGKNGNGCHMTAVKEEKIFDVIRSAIGTEVTEESTKHVKRIIITTDDIIVES